MRNGDRYVGKVVSLNADTLVLQGDVLGTQRLPRSRVAVIRLGAIQPEPAVSLAPTNRPPSAAPDLQTNANSDLAAMLRKLGAQTNLVQQVQKQFLTDASPEANKQFNELLGGLLSGKLTINDLRIQAKSVADQVRTLKQDLGEDTGSVVEGYLSILDKFLRDTAPMSQGTTNAPKPRGLKSADSP